jgi:8-oxo-dGTP pyrophosphatase MutT (NUDIX family)
MTELTSAGGVVFKNAEKGLRFAVMRSRFGTWVFPKGGVRPGEEKLAAARREVAEEVGLRRLRLVAELGATCHSFSREGERCSKTVHWFLFRAPSGAELEPDASQGALDAGWFSFPRALKLLSHPDQRRLLRKAARLLTEVGFRRPPAPPRRPFR